MEKNKRRNKRRNRSTKTLNKENNNHRVYALYTYYMYNNKIFALLVAKREVCKRVLEMTVIRH